MKWLLQYLYDLKLSKAILWCYLIWYLTIVVFYFDPSIKLWLNSLGISVVIGTGLVLSVSSGQSIFKDFWQIVRLYLMPFCVSSFSALIKGHEFTVFLSPKIAETAVAAVLCGIFFLVVFLVKSFWNKPSFDL